MMGNRTRYTYIVEKREVVCVCVGGGGDETGVAHQKTENESMSMRLALIAML